MSNDLVALKDFKRELEIIAPELPTSNAIPVEKMKSAIMVAVQKTPALLNADRSTLWQSARMCAADGLVPDGREAAFVLFKTKKGDSWIDAVQYLPMVAGLRKRIMNSGHVRKLIGPYLVYEGEWTSGRFEMVAGDEERVLHKPIILGAPGEPERGALLGGYAIAVTTEGERVPHWMPLADIEKRRRSAPSQRIYEKGKQPRVSDDPLGVWKDWYEDQCLKTVLRGLSKKLPLSSEDQRAIIESDHDFEPSAPTREQVRAPSLEDRLRAVQAPQERQPAPEPVEPDVEDAEVLSDEPTYDPDEASPMDDAYDEGVKAALAGGSEADNPHRSNPAFSSWVDGFRQAGRAK